MGFVIGKGREKLNNIETKTGALLKVIDNSLYFVGSAEQEKNAIREIKDNVVSLAWQLHDLVEIDENSHMFTQI